MVSIYPDPKYKDLKESISQYCHCKKENIIVGSGATELISSFISVLTLKKLYYFLHLIQNMKVNLKK